VVITDHHEAAEQTADATALVNPKLGDREEFKTLAGVGVAFKCCHALVKHARENGRSEAAGLDLKNFLHLVAVGTVADIVPLVNENRSLTRHGIHFLNQTDHPGFRALMDVAGIQEEVESYHIGYMIGPRLNAAGRLGTASLSLELLLTTDPHRARDVARELDLANRERRRIEQEMADEAIREIEESFDESRHFGLVVFGEGGHPGVIGIVASRVSRRFNRPAVVIGVDEEGCGRGSGRSIDAFNLVEGLEHCSEWLNRHGGHHMAAGLEIDRDRIDGFRQAFNEEARRVLGEADLSPIQPIDAWVSLDEIDERTMNHLRELGPFGMDNARPIWAVRGVRIQGRPKIVGSDHLKMTVAAGNRGLDAICFGQAAREIPEGPIDLAFYPQVNHYRGRKSIQLVVQDFRPSSGGAEPAF
jgi:single-stranded-DNA-specific exonuclease